jgi:NAD(P)H-dependent FMN reductase
LIIKKWKVVLTHTINLKIMYKLNIIIGSTRPGRKGPSIASWIETAAEMYSEFEVELIDLAEVNLPFLNEPNHPMIQKYEHELTMDWSKRINSADAFIIVTPEYNYSYTAPVKNALDYLYKEWNYKPVAFVSYGGVAGGTRAVQSLRLVVTALKMVPINESVNIPFFTKYIDNEGIFRPEEELGKCAEVMFVELLKWTKELKSMREK